jgi:hypothetical protein
MQISGIIHIANKNIDRPSRRIGSLRPTLFLSFGTSTKMNISRIRKSRYWIYILNCFKLACLFTPLAFIYSWHTEIIKTYTGLIFKLQSASMGENHGLICTELDARMGQLGDFWGGLMNPILSLVTILFVALTWLTTQRQLKNQREQLKLQHDEVEFHIFWKLFETQTGKIESAVKNAKHNNLIDLYVSRCKRINAGEYSVSITRNSDADEFPFEIELIRATSRAFTLLTEQKENPLFTRSYAVEWVEDLLGDMKYPLLRILTTEGFKSHENAIYREKISQAIINLELLKYGYLYTDDRNSHQLRIDTEDQPIEFDEQIKHEIQSAERKICDFYLEQENGMAFGESKELAQLARNKGR